MQTSQTQKKSIDYQLRKSTQENCLTYPVTSNDLIGKFYTIQQCIEKNLEINYKHWANILCLDTLKIVARFEEGIWKYD